MDRRPTANHAACSRRAAASPRLPKPVPAELHSERHRTLAKLSQGCTGAVQLGCRRYVTIAEPLATHHYTMLVQDLDDAALAEFMSSPEFRCRGTRVTFHQLHHQQTDG